MMMTVNEVSKLAGVSIRTLQYYDKIGLLHPTGYTDAGYRLYDDADLERLQHILLFRELEFPLKDIKMIVNSPDFDRSKALEQQIELLKLKKEHIENLMNFALGIKLLGVKHMDFKAFDRSKLDEYSRQAKELYGNTPEYKEMEEKQKNRTEEDEKILADRFMLFFKEAGEMKNMNPASDDAQNLVRRLQDYITQNLSDADFLYYLICSPLVRNPAIKSMVGSSGRQRVQTDVVANLDVELPPIEEQRKIGGLLKAIDDKIELNDVINNNLLQQLHILYSRLFCNSAMDTPLGEVVATTSGGTPSRKHDEYYSDSSICWVKSKELLGNYIHETEEHINDLAIKKSSAKLLPKHSVLIAMYGATVGACGVISKPMTCNQAVCALLCNENYPYTYLFQIAYESQQKFINLAVGSAQQNISQVLIKQLNLHSDLNIIQKFHGLALPMHQEIESLQAENMHLAALRDNLLPKLMSGELDVSNIDL